MNFTYTNNPTLSDVETVIENSDKISEEKRRAVVSALHSLAKWTGENLSDIPASIPELARRFDRVQPHAVGISPKTRSNVKASCFDAVALSEVVPGVVNWKIRGRPRSPEWREYWSGLSKVVERNSLSRLVNWCNAQSITPKEVNTDIIERMMAHMKATSFRQNQYQVHRTTARMWNEIVDRFPQRDLTKVEVPVSRLRRSRTPIEKFPRSLHQDWADFAAWAHGDDIFADDDSPRVKQSTLDNYQRRFHNAISLLVETGIDPSAIRKVADVTTPDAMKRILGRRHESSNGEASYETFFLGQLLVRLARDWVKAPPDEVAELKRLTKKLPRPTFMMTAKNQLLVDEFDDPKLLQRFVSTPDRIWNDMMCNSRRRQWRLAEAQASLGISILQNTAIRLGDLTALQFGKHVTLRPGGTSTLRTLAAETKTGHPVDFDLPATLAERLIEYHDVIAPAEIGQRPKYLFTNTDGSVKGFAAVRYLVQRYVKAYAGIHVNPHAYRHIAAKLVLDDNPGAHVLVQHLLGHKSVNTAANYYAGLNTRRAGRHHQALLAREVNQAQTGRDHRSSGRRG
ncbi:site-specific integrase [Aquibium sp. LZ166]|uniref:Site-specific integrase n=1 Tax=Aquibium pacificus TaxID=3153579 RepID=A0ABV3SKL0_9HYPH